MSEFGKTIEKRINQKLGKVHTAIRGKITSVGDGVASVQPDGDYPLLTNLPVITHRYEYEDGGVTKEVEGPVYQKGDRVLVVFFEKDLSDGIIVGMVK